MKSQSAKPFLKKSTRGDFEPQGMFGNVWKEFWWSRVTAPPMLGWEVLLTSTGWGRRCCHTCYCAWDRFTMRNYPAQNNNSTRIAKPQFILQKFLNQSKSLETPHLKQNTNFDFDYDSDLFFFFLNGVSNILTSDPKKQTENRAPDASRSLQRYQLSTHYLLFNSGKIYIV